MPASKPTNTNPHSAPSEDFLKWSSHAQRNESIAAYTTVMKMADEASVLQVKSLTNQVEKAFIITQFIYKSILFILGVSFIISGILAFWPGIGNFQKTVGAIGLPTILVTLLLLLYHNPLHNVRKAMGDIVKMQVIYLSYLRQVNQVDIGFKQNFFTNDKVTAKQYQETFNQMHGIIDKALDDINLLMDDVN